jgi:hypothetical protein
MLGLSPPVPPVKKLRMTELSMTDSVTVAASVTVVQTLTADELNRFSRQNAALGRSLIAAKDQFLIGSTCPDLGLLSILIIL